MTKDHPRREGRSRLVMTVVMLGLAAIFIALGSWQVQRLFWKLDLIARVDARVHAEAVNAPEAGARVTAENDEYRHVRATGTFEHDRSVLVQAVTDLGAGFWVVTPLRLDDGSAILINRGFVPADRRDRGERREGETGGRATVTGLLRLTEPDGGFLRSNDPAADRWFSRDVAAIATAKAISPVASYFIDADATANPGGLPVGGLTVVRFRNSHLVYALTWFALAGMSLGGAWLVRRRRVSDHEDVREQTSG